MMEKLEVGSFYRKGIYGYPRPDGPKFFFDNSGGVIELFFRFPTQEELDNIRSGPMKIGLLEKNGIIFVFVKFGAMEWMDIPYNPNLSGEFEFQEVEEGKGYGITILLIEATNGEIQCIRYIGAPTRWSRDFKRLTLELKERAFNKDFYDKSINEIYRNYSTPELLKYADIYKV